MPLFPTPQELFLNIAPWKSSPIGPGDYVNVLMVQFFVKTIDLFCVECNQPATFKSDVRGIELNTPVYVGREGGSSKTPIYLSVEDVQKTSSAIRVPYNSLPNLASSAKRLEDLEGSVLEDRNFEVPFTCTRNALHQSCFYFRVQNKSLIKVGQYPSMADLQMPLTSKYKSVLTSDQMREFNKAIGLHAHGVGIGAFIYLRRIFEAQIEAAKIVGKLKPDFVEAEFEKARMEDKIKTLRDHLPEFLVTHRSIYSILSRGVHSLSDDECLQHFNVIRAGIEIILDEKLAAKEKEAKTAKASQAIALVSAKIG